MTKFFNAYIQNISTSIAWGDGATCQIDLVEDPQNGVNLNIPSYGAPVGFSLGSFYFGGIFQRGSYKESLSGRTFNVVIESPAKYLDGIQVILSDFNGQVFNGNTRYSPASGPAFTNQIYNVWNPFAHRENYQYGGIYGGSNVNSMGFPVSDALQLIELISNGGSYFGGRAVFGNYTFSVNLSEIRNVLSGSKYRLKGPVQSLSSIIQECCELAGLDYYCEVVGNIGNNNIIENPTINIRTIFRGYQPTPGAVEQLVSNAENNGTLISKNIGYEWSVPTTQQLVIGGKASRMLIQTSDTTIPIWGKLQNNQYIFNQDLALTPFVYSSPTYRVPISLDEYSGVIGYYASIFELRMATGGRESWETFKTFETMYGVEVNGYNDYLYAPWYGKVADTKQTFDKLVARQTGQIVPSSDFENSSWKYAIKRVGGYLNEISDKIWSAVSRVANNFYGQVFLMQINTYEPGGLANNIRFIQEDVQQENAWDIADSAWVPVPLFADLNFYDGEGRMKGGAAWPQNPFYDYSSLGSDWAVTPDGGIATNKGGPDKEIYWINNLPYVIVRSGGQVTFQDGLTTPDFGLSVLIWLFTGQWIDPRYYLSAGAQNLQISIPPNIVAPTSFGVPQESNRYTWGPWWVWNNGSPGRSEIKFDESLRPEVFGSEALLDAAGFAAAETGLAQSALNETGSVELIGLPFANVADQFGGGGPYINGMSVSVGTGGITTTYQFQSWTPKFGALSQTNIERIKNVRKGLLAFAQNKRSQITRKPLPQLRFEKSDLASLSEQFKRSSPSMMGSVFPRIIDENLNGARPSNLPSSQSSIPQTR